MGLDMYLSRSVHISNYEFDPEGQRIARAILQALNVTNYDAYKNGSLEIQLPAAYWRKANAVHGWFVRNVQDGVDDCRSAYVSVEQLKELRNLCNDILADRRPKEDLPPTEGFFFGSTDDDTGYRDDLLDTVRQINTVLDAPGITPYDSFYYRSSW